MKRVSRWSRSPSTSESHANAFRRYCEGATTPPESAGLPSVRLFERIIEGHHGEDIRGDLIRARHRLSKLLLRHDVRFEGKAWTERHRGWLATVELREPAAQATFCDYRGAVEALIHRRGELERQVASLIPSSPWAREVARLRCLRGVDTLTAVGLCAEIGDFARFAKAGQLASYLGLVPSEHPSGDSRRLGAVTRSGSRHAQPPAGDALQTRPGCPFAGNPIVGHQRR